MSPGNDEGAPGQERQTSSNSRQNKSTTSARQKQPPPAVFAEVREVSGRLRDRLELFVRCPACHRLHCHRAPVEFLAGVRTAACGCKYTVVAGLARDVAA